MKTLEEIIEGAIALIQQGWTQGSGHRVDEDGQDHYCTIGALSTCADRLVGSIHLPECWAIYVAAFERVEEQIRQEVADPNSKWISVFPIPPTIVSFNDCKKTSKEDVLLILKKSLGDG